MIPPTAGSAAALVTISRKKPLSVCFERAWMSRYPNLFREELSELARSRGGADPSTVDSAADATEPAEAGEVANGNSCEPVGSDPQAAVDPVAPEPESPGRVLLPVRVRNPIFDWCPNLDGFDELALDCLRVDPVKFAHCNDRRKYEIVAAQLACARPLNSLKRRPLYMVSTRRNPDTDEAVAVPAAAELSGSLTLNVTDRDTQRDISNTADVNVANVNNVAAISNAAPSNADQVQRTTNAENFAAGERAACDAAEARAAALERELLELRSRLAPFRGDGAGTSHAAHTNVDQQGQAAAAATAAAAVPAVEAQVNVSDLRSALDESERDRTSAQLSGLEATLIRLLQQQMQRTVTEQMVRPPTESKARPSDVGLSEFSGAASKVATVIEPEYYPRMLLWLEESDQLLRNSGLTTIEQVRTLFSHLTGAARKQFTTRWRNLDYATMTMKDAKDKIFALVPNHATHFSRAAMDMNFRASCLASDLDRFALYASHGDLPVNGHHFWYRMVQDKLLEACPDLFRVAAEHFGKRIEFDPRTPFQNMIDKFMDIVLAVQTELRGKLLGEKRPHPQTGGSPSDPRPSPGPVKKRKRPEARLSYDPSDLTDDFTVAKGIKMRFGCGKLYPAGNNGRRVHDASCKKKFVKGICSDEFRAGIRPWRRLADSGKSASELLELANAQRPN
jgi:hypothetical protein